jgi:hypothetical protein
MKILRLIVIALLSVLLVECSCSNNKKNEKKIKDQPQVKIPEKTTATPGKPVQGPKMEDDAKPGFQNMYERGNKRRESIKDKFDDKGNLIERTDEMYDKDGNVRKKNRYTYKYNDAGNRIEQWYYASDPNDAPLFSQVNYMKYNDKGMQTENVFISYDENGIENRWAKNIYTYNNESRVMEDKLIEKNGVVKSRILYTYDKGFLVQEIFLDYDDSGNQLNKKTIKYNEKGTVISAVDE